MYSLDGKDCQNRGKVLTLDKEQRRVRKLFGQNEACRKGIFEARSCNFEPADLSIYLLLIWMGSIAMLAMHRLWYIIIDLRPSLARLVLIIVCHGFSVFVWGSYSNVV